MKKLLAVLAITLCSLAATAKANPPTPTPADWPWPTETQLANMAATPACQSLCVDWSEYGRQAIQYGYIPLTIICMRANGYYYAASIFEFYYEAVVLSPVHPSEGLDFLDNY